MAASDRTVKQLQLAAPSEDAVRRVLPTLEDALRCASLGDEGAQLIVVKRLALGRVPANISPQALSLLIEQRAAAVARQSVEAESADADGAPCVAFAGMLDARVRLALRLLRGAPCHAWYWPLAVPEFEPRGDLATNLQRMAWTIADWPEARAALPAWVAALVRTGGTPRLAACMAAEQGEALLRRAGLATQAAQAAAQRAAAAPPWHDDVVPDSSPLLRANAASAPAPAWVRVLLELAAPTPASARRVLDPAAGSAAEVFARAAVNAPLVREHSAPDAAQPLRQPLVQHPAAALPVAHDAVSQQGENAAVQLPAVAGTMRRAAQVQHRAPTHGATARAWLAPTECGGLLFLLPLLQRLDLPAWLPQDDTRIAACVLRAALLRLRVAPDDPAWQLAATQDNDAPAYDVAAPACWADPLLAARRGGVTLAMRLQRSGCLANQADAWLAAARYWLRRAGRIGLASLLLRPARLAVTATHADVFFDLAATDLRVRRLGLDADPGWLPWFGRVVSFHYDTVP
jgi:hypothetical protein